MADFSFSSRQVVMLENYYHHVNCVPDDELLKKLTAAVIRMDKTNSGVSENLVRNWFLEREKENVGGGAPLDDRKLIVTTELEGGWGHHPGGNRQKLVPNGRAENLLLEEEMECHLELPESTSDYQLTTPVPIDDVRSRSYSAHTSLGEEWNEYPRSGGAPILHVPARKMSKSNLPKPVFKRQEEDGTPAEKLHQSVERVRRARTISSGNLKSLLTRSAGAPLARVNLKAQSARDVRTEHREILNPFVSRPRVPLQWPNLDNMESQSHLMIVEFGMREKYCLEVGRDVVDEEDFSLFDEENNSPHFQREFVGSSYFTFGGTSETHGPVVLTLKPMPQQLIRDGQSMIRGAAYVIVRTVVEDERMVIPFKETFASGSTKKAILKAFKKSCNRFDGINFSKLCTGPPLESSLLSFENHFISSHYKFGVLYSQPGQTENEMFCNKEGSEAFHQFLDFLGERIELQGWNKFRGGLDVKTNTTGTHAYFAKFDESEIIFHVSTLLPHDELNSQQLERKRHLGNDVVLIIFLDTEDASFKWDPEIMCSQVNQVFVLVRPCMTQKGKGYYINIVNKKGVPPYQPFLSSPPVLFEDQDCKQFFLLKIINAERAAMCAPVYRNKLRRSRRQMLQNIIDSYPEA